jgi:colanic acid biosynthesis glycosyl transferase WcaI
VKVLIVSQYFWPENFRINDLAAGLVERGHLVTVLTGIPNYPGGRFFSGYGLFRKVREEYKGIRILRVPLVPRGDGGGIRLAFNYLSFSFFASILSPFICRGKFDLIFVYEPSPITVGLPAVVLKKLKSVPILFWVQDLWPESLSATGAVRSKTILNVVRKLVCFIYRHCDRILIQSPAFAPLIEEQGVDPKRITFFPNSVEEIYKPAFSHLNSDNGNLLPSGFRIMFAGNIGVAQDFGTILLAAEKLKDHSAIKWVILGDGRRFEWVKGEVKSRGLSDTVHLLGRHPPEVMSRFFAGADVMLVTLKRDPIFALTIPSKIQSYMACHKPIVAALDGEGGRLIMESGAGLASPAEDADALASSILTLFLMPKEDLEAMGKRGKTYCDANFEREMLIDQLEGMMRENCPKAAHQGQIL